MNIPKILDCKNEHLTYFKIKQGLSHLGCNTLYKLLLSPTVFNDIKTEFAALRTIKTGGTIEAEELINMLCRIEIYGTQEDIAYLITPYNECLIFINLHKSEENK